MDSHEQSRHLQLWSFIIKDRAIIRGGEWRVHMLIFIAKHWVLYLAKLTPKSGSDTQNESSKLKFGMNRQPIHTTLVIIMTFDLCSIASEQSN